MSGALSERLAYQKADQEDRSPVRFGAPSNDQPRQPPRNDLVKIKAQIQRELVAELGSEVDLSTTQGRRQLDVLLNELVEAQGLSLPRVERQRFLEGVIAEVLSFGPIEPLLRDPAVNEVMVNGPYQVWVERAGRLSRTDIQFEDDDHVRRIIDRIIAPLGRRCDEASPMVDARLPDGSRVNAIIPPLSLVGPVITIRKFSRDVLSMDQLIRLGTVTREVADFLAACVAGRLNIIVSGGTGSGKTTLLNILSTSIPDSERIITIEDAAELQLRQEHVITLEKRPPSIEGRGGVGIRDRNDLIVNLGVHRARSSRPPGARHASGHEYGPRRFNDHGPLQQSARHPGSSRDHRSDGGLRLAAPGYPRADRVGRRPHRPSGTVAGRQPQDCADL